MKTIHDVRSEVQVFKNCTELSLEIKPNTNMSQLISGHPLEL